MLNRTGLLLTVVLATAAGAATFAVDGGAVTIDTARYRAGWRDGCLVSWRTKLPAPAELTVGGAMTPEQIPSGLCSLAGQEQAAREQHHPWNFLKLDATFPAQHPAGAQSKLSTARIPGGLRLTYQGLTGEPDATLVQELVVEEGSGDLLLRQTATSPNPGVVGIAFSLLNVRGDIELAMPYFGGQRWGREFAEGRVIGIAYTQFWHAGLVIGEVPGGGSFMVWAEDPNMRPKYFYLRHQGTTQGLSFEGLPESPYDTRTSAELFTWRLNTFAGSWVEPARRYRDWLVKTHHLVKRSERPSNWVDDIALLWPTSPSDRQAGSTIWRQPGSPHSCTMRPISRARSVSRSCLSCCCLSNRRAMSAERNSWGLRLNAASWGRRISPVRIRLWAKREWVARLAAASAG